jgi:hypothetical protein
VCIFAYGQTGSGKTHTMTGSEVDAAEGRGINYRALDDLFALRNERSSEVSMPLITPPAAAALLCCQVCELRRVGSTLGTR